MFFTFAPDLFGLEQTSSLANSWLKCTKSQNVLRRNCAVHETLQNDWENRGTTVGPSCVCVCVLMCACGRAQMKHGQVRRHRSQTPPGSKELIGNEQCVRSNVCVCVCCVLRIGWLMFVTLILFVVNVGYLYMI